VQTELEATAAAARAAAGEAFDGGTWGQALAGKRACLSGAMRLALQDENLPYRLVEIGFNAGHSSALMLHNFPEASVTSFDLCAHAYWRDCLSVLRRVYGEGRISVVCGDSARTVPSISGTFDAVFVDGSHLYAHVRDDFRHLHRIAATTRDRRPLVVADDCDTTHVALAWSHAINAGLIAPVSLCEHVGLCVGRFVRVLEPDQTA